MSTEFTPTSPEHFQYIQRLCGPEDPFLASLRHEALAAGIPPISIGFAQARFLQILLRIMGARSVVEVGTLAGYSAIAMAEALPAGGVVRTIECNAKHAAFAQAQVAKSRVAGRVQVLLGSGDEHLERMESGSVDAMFLDADKAGYPRYLKQGMRLLRVGGLLLADNAFAFGELFAASFRDRETPAIREFNEQIAVVSNLQSVLVPVGDGLWVATKTRDESPHPI